MSIKLLILVVFSSAVLGAEAFGLRGCSSGAYAWISKSFANTSLLEAGGHEWEYNFFVGRVPHNGGIIPGAWSVNGNFYIVYLDNEIDKLDDDFEVLQAMSGALNWVNMTNGGIPPNPAVIGIYPDLRDEMYACRHYVGEGDNVILGNIRSTASVCTVAHYGVVYKFTEGYEVLSLSDYGRLIEEHNTCHL